MRQLFGKSPIETARENIEANEEEYQSMGIETVEKEPAMHGTITIELQLDHQDEPFDMLKVPVSDGDKVTVKIEGLVEELDMGDL